MNNLSRFLLLLILVLLQVTVMPLNFAFVFLFASVLLIDKFNAAPWLIVLSFFLSIFSNLNFGLVLIAFTSALLILEMVKLLVPQNNLTKVMLVLVSLPIANLSLLTALNFLQ